ncbi:MAG: outer membrane protein assembly factor BamD [Deltaproteobacteria bacterium]|nr:outer membrane protein assembly factor BamD [Deltaproteobacteria bacterium]
MRFILIFFLLLALLVSCLPKQTKPVRSPGSLYVDGVNLMSKKKYDAAIKNFSQIRENYPFDPVAPYAMVKMADCYFFKKDYVTASRLYEEFMNNFPNDENVPYVILKVGECYEKLSLSYERDQEYTYRAIEKYSLILDRFPKSQYVKEAENRKKSLEQKLVNRELHVGEFYFKTYQYNACILRLEELLENYPHASGLDKALFYLSKAHAELGNFEKSEQYLQRLKHEYPKSPYVGRTKTGQKLSVNEKKQAPPVPSQVELEEKQEKKERTLPPEIKESEKKEREKFKFFEAKKPIDIVADKMEGFEKEGRIFFEGEVVLTQEDLTILCDTLEAYLSDDKKNIEKVHAKGNVKIFKGERTATCKEAYFDNKLGNIILKGEVNVISGPDRLKGDTITYYLNEERVVVQAEKNKKAKVIIFPR